MGSHSLLQGIFPTQGSNLGLLHCRQIHYHLSHQGSPRILEWLSYPFSRGSSPPRNWTWISCIAGRFLTSWPTNTLLTAEEAVCMHAQSCPTLCDPMDCGPPGSSVHGISQARLLEWVAMSFSRGSSRPRDWTNIFCGSCIGRQILYHWATWKPTEEDESEREWNCSVMSSSFLMHALWPTRLLCPWDFPGKSTGVAAISGTNLNITTDLRPIWMVLILKDLNYVWR